MGPSEIAEEDIEAGPESWTSERLLEKYPIKLQISTQDMILAQEKDHVLRVVREWLKVDVVPAKKSIKHLSKHLKYYRSIFKLLRLSQNNIVVFIDHFQNNRQLLCIPYSLREKVFHHAHTDKLAGHFGISATLKRVRARFHFPEMQLFISAMTMSCQACIQKIKFPANQKSVFISRELSAPFQKISWDIVGKLPKSPDQNVFLLTMIDQFTRWPEAVPLPDKSAQSIAKALFSTRISRYGVISQLHGDNSLENRSELTK